MPPRSAEFFQLERRNNSYGYSQSIHIPAILNLRSRNYNNFFNTTIFVAHNDQLRTILLLTFPDGHQKILFVYRIFLPRWMQSNETEEECINAEEDLDVWDGKNYVSTWYTSIQFLIKEISLLTTYSCKLLLKRLFRL